MSDISVNSNTSIPSSSGQAGSLVADLRNQREVVVGMSLWEKLGWLLMAVLLVGGLPMAYQRAIDSGPDLAGFCDAGRYILQHGTRDPESTLARYWPSADVPWIAFSLLPISVTAVLWYCLSCVTWIGLLYTINSRLLVGSTSESVRNGTNGLGSPFSDSSIRRHATLAAGLLAMPLVIDGMAMGSFHILMVWLMIVGLDRACRGLETSGGIVLGLGAWLKLLPMLGIGFLLYQRKWKAAVIATATVALLDVFLSLAAFGPAGAWREHVLWWKEGAKGTADRQLAADMPIDEDRLTNQSVAITLRRMLTSLGTTTVAKAKAGPSADSTPGKHELTIDGRARRHVQLAEITPQQLHIVFLAALGLIGLGIAIYCRPVSLSAWAAKGPAKITMIVLATLWFSPVTWSYHFIAATPAVATLLLRARYRMAWVLPVLAVWCGALVLLAWDACRAGGVLLWMSVLIGAGMVLYPAALQAREVSPKAQRSAA